MTQDIESQIRERLAKATPGPWEHAQDEVMNTVVHFVHTQKKANSFCISIRIPGTKEHDADLIANAPSDLAWLLAERDLLSRKLEVAMDLIRGEGFDDIADRIEGMK